MSTDVKVDEQLKQLSEEQVIKAKKHQMLLYMQNYVKESKPQLEYQKVVTELAELRLRELKANVEFNHILAETKRTEPKTHILTQEDLDQLPILVEKGFEIGDEIDLSKSPSEQVKIKKD